VRRSIILTALFLAACGRPATEAECDEIVTRIAQLELGESKVSDKAEVEKQVQETREAFRAKTREQCVGKRVTERALGCVRNAKTAEEIVQECLN
jgi:inorganic pyrophosphatase